MPLRSIRTPHVLKTPSTLQGIPKRPAGDSQGFRPPCSTFLPLRSPCCIFLPHGPPRPNHTACAPAYVIYLDSYASSNLEPCALSISRDRRIISSVPNLSVLTVRDVDGRRKIHRESELGEGTLGLVSTNLELRARPLRCNPVSILLETSTGLEDEGVFTFAHDATKKVLWGDNLAVKEVIRCLETKLSTATRRIDARNGPRSHMLRPQPLLLDRHREVYPGGGAYLCERQHANEEERGFAADLNYVELATHQIAVVATTSKIVVEKSTVPCRTAESMRTILEVNSKPGCHFDILSNPEFLAKGIAISALFKPDRVPIGSLQTAEGKDACLSKLTANAMLNQHISSVNALSAICDVTVANIDEVVNAVGYDSRVGHKFLKVSVGFSGSCFQKDILNLVYLSKSLHLPEVAAYWRQVVEMRYTLQHHHRTRASPLPSRSSATSSERAFVNFYDPQNIKKYVKICKSTFEARRDAEAVGIATERKEFKTGSGTGRDARSSSVRERERWRGRGLVVQSTMFGGAGLSESPSLAHKALPSIDKSAACSWWTCTHTQEGRDRLDIVPALSICHHETATKVKEFPHALDGDPPRLSSPLQMHLNLRIALGKDTDVCMPNNIGAARHMRGAEHVRERSPVAGGVRIIHLGPGKSQVTNAPSAYGSPKIAHHLLLITETAAVGVRDVRGDDS
ncbi:UDP-glucose/GDP-mannose dehydrogenase family, central domain-containing protein [Mycena sanguinolenta]|nr:UDP-glucose/GDP-mannose dehydrogenase family, central domain-containing protein [Mycena sanguinolenta]